MTERADLATELTAVDEIKQGTSQAFDKVIARNLIAVDFRTLQERQSRLR